MVNTGTVLEKEKEKRKGDCTLNDDNIESFCVRETFAACPSR